MSEPAIAIRDIWKFFGEYPAVRGVNLDIPAGGIVALLGRNGAGKTTLLRMIAGLLPPQPRADRRRWQLRRLATPRRIDRNGRPWSVAL